LLSAGVTVFLDLTEEGEYGLKAYEPLLREEADALGCSVVYRRISIPDMQTPTRDEMIEILDTIDTALEAGHVVYVHCYGGIGRTGTVVGCYLVRQGTCGEKALLEIARLREGTPDGWKRSPETFEQREFVRTWSGN
jgi:protein-tyrosine phosphatase